MPEVQDEKKPLARLNLLDRAVAFVNPQAGLERALTREALHEFAYDGAFPGRERGWSGGQSKNAPSESIRAQTDRVRLMWDARDMERNFSMICGILDRTVAYSCARLTYQPETGDRDINKKYRDYWNEWCRNADYEKKCDFNEMVELGLRGMLRDGDSGFIKRYDGFDIKLQAIEGDRIGNPLAIGDSSEKYVSGVGLTDAGAPDFYRIFRRTRTAQYDNPEDIPANRFIHLYKPIRCDQVRGFSWLASVLPLARDLFELFGYERTAAKYSSQYAAFKEMPDPFAKTGTGTWNRRNLVGPALDAIIPGKIQKLGPGEKITFPSMPNRPNNSFIQHVQAIIKEMAVGLDLPFGFIYDMSEFGGATVRIETMQAQRAFERFQHLLERRMLHEIKDDVISNGIARGLIPPHPNWKKGRFSYGMQITADAGYQTQADLALYAQGLKSAHSIVTEMGYNFEDVVDTVGNETQAWYDQAIKHQIPLELINSKFQGATDLLAAMNGPTQQEQEQQQQENPPTLIEQYGDKSGMVILDAMEKVGMGVLTRESAVNFLVTFLGLDPQVAESMIPPKGKRQDTAKAAAKADIKGKSDGPSK